MRFAFVCFLTALRLAAQTTAQVEVAVTGPAGEPLRYSTIEITGGEARFTTEDGKLNFVVPGPGRYAVRVKHLGFSAVDTSVVVASASKVELKVMLQPVAIRLSSVEVRDKNSCKAKGGQSSNLSIALEELSKNAERDQILRNSYPFVYKLARHYTSMDPQFGRPYEMKDTLSFESRTSKGYRPGNIFQPAQGASRGGREVRIPSLADLADGVFTRNHCFSFAGLDSIETGPAYRIDFTPTPGIRTPDFAGTAFLDTATYMIRKLEFRITNIGRSVAPGLTVTTTFRELFPGLALFYNVHGVQAYGSYALVDDQKLIEINFLRGSPSSPQSKVNQ